MATRPAQDGPNSSLHSPFKRYVVTDAQGNVLRRGTCRPRDLAAQAGPGESVEEFNHVGTPLDDRFHRIRDGQRESRYTQAEIDAMQQAKADLDSQERERVEALRAKLVLILDPAVQAIITDLFEAKYGVGS